MSNYIEKYHAILEAKRSNKDEQLELAKVEARQSNEILKNLEIKLKKFALDITDLQGKSSGKLMKLSVSYFDPDNPKKSTFTPQAMVEYKMASRKVEYEVSIVGKEYHIRLFDAESERNILEGTDIEDVMEFFVQQAVVFFD